VQVNQPKAAKNLRENAYLVVCFVCKLVLMHLQESVAVIELQRRVGEPPTSAAKPSVCYKVSLHSNDLLGQKAKSMGGIKPFGQN
jgi:hypothetical protein